MCAEPEQLKRGKKFHALAQADFKKKVHDGQVRLEETISLKELKRCSQNSGRIDIFIKEPGGFATIVEIKATDWDRIKPENVRRNLYRHQRQIFKYIEKYIDVEKMDVCPGIIYPEPPRRKGLRKLIEGHLEENYGLPAYWQSEIGSDSKAGGK